MCGSAVSVPVGAGAKSWGTNSLVGVPGDAPSPPQALFRKMRDQESSSGGVDSQEFETGDRVKLY